MDKVEEALKCPGCDCGDKNCVGVLAAEVRRLLEELSAEQTKRVNEYAHAERLVEWIRDPKRKHASVAFNDGPERQVASVVEQLVWTLENVLGIARDALPYGSDPMARVRAIEVIDMVLEKK